MPRFQCSRCSDLAVHDGPISAEYITFLDDDFFCNKKRLSAFCQALTREFSNRIVWECQARANSVTEDSLRMAKAAGCQTIRFGFESGSDRSLTFLKNESTSVSENYRAAALCQQAGIPCFGTFMIGAPDETIDDILQTIQFIEQSRITGASIYVLTPYPGTEMDRIAVERGYYRSSLQWNDYLMDADLLMEGERLFPLIRNGAFSAMQLANMQRYIFANVTFPLCTWMRIPKRNHRAELERILKGDLSHARVPRLDVARYYMSKALRNPSRIFPFLKKRLEWIQLDRKAANG